MRPGRIGIALVIVFVLTGCSGLRRDGTRPPVGQVAVAVAFDGARSMVDIVEVVFVRAPAVFLVDLPMWLFYETPRTLLARSSVATEVAMLLDRLRDDAPQSVRMEAGRELRELAGLPIEDAAEWRAWWSRARTRPRSAWRGDFADECLRELVSGDYLARQAADARLRALSGEDVGYDPNGTPEEIALGAEQWHAWRRTLGEVRSEE